MAKLEELVEQAIKDGVYSGCIMCAQSKDGKLSYAKAFGKASVDSDAKDMQLDTVMQIASMTKLATTIACLQLVESGKIGLDDDVKKYIPELVEQGVIEGVSDDGKADTTPIKGKITLRLLLTHSAGTSYDMWSPPLLKLRKAQGKTPGVGATIHERMLYPLVYQPGTSWQYSTGIDWAGRVVEKITGETLDSYFEKNMWPKVGVKDFTFFPDQEMRCRLAQITVRGADGKVTPLATPFFNEGVTDCFGGGGGYATITDYIKILHSILVNDEKLLQKDTVEQMFQGQLTAESKAAMQGLFGMPEVAALFIGDFPHPDALDWGLGGVLIEKDHGGRRKQNTLIWSGIANCFWFIDREAGLCGVFGTQVLPPGDAKVEETIKAFELQMNERLSKL